MIESICLSPHGDELLGDDAKFSLLRAILRGCGSDASAASSFLVVSPHGVRVSGHVSISRSERICSGERCYAVDGELARSIHEHCARFGAPSVLIGFGTDSGEQSVLPLDWGSEIPLRFFPSARSVVVAVPPRDVPWERLVAFGEAAASAIWSSPEPVGIIVSADQAHAHSPGGPYGYSPRAKEFDAAVIEMVRSGALESLLGMDRGLVEDAKPDSPWQLLVLAGILRRARSDVVEMAYQVATYYGMLAARYSRPVRRRHGSPQILGESEIKRINSWFPCPALSSPPVLRVSNLRVRYGQKVAVDGISFQIMPGEIYGLLGPNGAGKSSTIKAIVNLVDYEGEVDLLGMGRPRGKLLNEVGAVLETPAVLESLTVKEFLELVASIRGVGGDRIDALVQAFGLGEYLGTYIATLSQGNRQKVAIASALMHRPKLLILDEPFNALDVKSARILKEVVQNHRRDGGAVLFSTHVMEIAERTCDRIGILNGGRLIMEGTTKSILEQARAGSLEEAFLRAIHAEEEIRELAEAL